MDNLNEKYPILTAWTGFMAIMSVGAFFLGLIFSNAGFWLNNIARLIFVFVLGFFVFRFMIERHISGNLEEPSTHAEANQALWQKFSIQTAWISFLLLYFLPGIFLRVVTASLPFPWGFLVSFFLAIFIGCFIFALVIS